MRVEIARLHSEIGATMIYVTHDQVEAMTLADRIVVMNRGTVEQIGSPLDLYERPANRFVAEFLGQPKMNFLAAQVVDRADDRVTLNLRGGTRPLELPVRAPAENGAAVELGFRPDTVTLCSPDAADLPGSVAVVEHLGSESIVYVAIEGLSELFAAVAPGKSPLRRGDKSGLKFNGGSYHVFDANGKALS